MSSADTSKSRFISLRWRLIVPTFVVVLILAMASAYVIARSLPSSAEMSRVSVLRSTGRVIADHAAALAEQQKQAAEQLAQMPEIAAALQTNRDPSDLLENFARRADLDAALVSAADQVYGVLRGADGVYHPTTLQEAGALTLLMAAPISGAKADALVGTHFTRWLDNVRGSAAAEIALYDDRRLLTTTFNSSASIPATPPVEGADLFQALDVNNVAYIGAFFPLADVPQVVAVFLPDNAPFAAEAAQQLVALTLTTVAAGIVITVFVMSNFILDRVNRVRQVAEALAAGDFAARTGMKPTDEIGALGQALDIYSDRVQARHDNLRDSLRRQRREIEYLNAVLEAQPDGAIVLDLDGSVTFINEHAKQLIGEGYNFFKRSELRDITAAVTDILGPALAPGLYTLGSVQRMDLDGRTLNVQAFAVLSMADQRVGTAILVRDVTEEVLRERTRAALLNQISEGVELPLLPDAALSRDIRRNSATLQKLIVEMRDLVASGDAQVVQQLNRALPLETLIWAVANEWRQVAQAANLTLSVSVERPGLFVQGDERRLRWALGNIVDNAIKYTPPGGKVSVEIKDEDSGFARLRIRDNGVGIAPDELPNVFMRFYRGNPVNANGRTLRVPGTGQGLTIARQIIESHGGRIYLRSQLSVGTAVYFTLPLSGTESLPLLPPDEGEEETLRLQNGASGV